MIEESVSSRLTLSSACVAITYEHLELTLDEFKGVGVLIEASLRLLGLTLELRGLL